MDTAKLKTPLTRKQLAEQRASLKMTTQQREVLVGLILGDAHLGTQDLGRTWRLIYSQSKGRHGAYLQHVYEIFSGWALSPPVLIRGAMPTEHHKVMPGPALGSDGLPRSGAKAEGLGALKGKPAGRYLTKDRLKFTTVSHKSLRFYGKSFYKDGVKVVPKGIGRLLTARGLAYWYMDDGSIKSRQSKGVILNTHSFSLAEVNLLCGVLNDKFGLRASLRPRRLAPASFARDGSDARAVRHQIYISGHSYEAARELILPHLLPEMMYKFPTPRKPGESRTSVTG